MQLLTLNISGPCRPHSIKYTLQSKDGKPRLLSANAGDARVILARGGKGLQLSEDHTPDV
jgi:serine/threonine protein phosphatase PrpC